MPEKTVDNNLNELIDILTREQAVFQEFLELLNEHQRQLLRGDLDGIGPDKDRISALALEAANLEKIRRTVLSRIARGIMAESERKSIARILSVFDNPRFEGLERFKDTMLEIYRHISDQKTRNEFLIEQSITMISQTMQLIHEISNSEEAFGNIAISGGQNSQRGTYIEDDSKCANPMLAGK